MLLLASVLLVLATFSDASTRPNIVIILADDLGWNDVSFHGSNQFLTANIDALAYSGIILRNYYTQPICTPSRAALLTGRHPIHNGMEDDVLYGPQPWGLPLTEKLLPQYLERAGYMSHAVGKWHLGFFKGDYTPTRRGFLSHYGNWLGGEDHYRHTSVGAHPGYDFRRGMNVSWEAYGRYTTDLLTDEAVSVINGHDTSQPMLLYLAHVAPHAPLQAPASLVDKFQYIPTLARRKFAAMVTSLDESVGRVVDALKNKRMLNNSIILFLTDNGGATHGFNGNVASNFPLRGGKDTLWEGGLRAVGLIWSPLLQGVQRVHHGFVNVQDWLPTLLSAANVSTEYRDPSLDGMSQWNALNGLSPSPYDTILHNIDPVRRIAALRYRQWKLVIGRTYNGRFDGFYGRLNGEVRYTVESVQESVTGRALESTSAPLPEPQTILSLRAGSTISCTNSIVECEPHIAPCLFDISQDPCERENVASSNQDIVVRIISILEMYNLALPNNKPDDPRGYPIHWNFTWVNWMDYLSQPE